MIYSNQWNGSAGLFQVPVHFLEGSYFRVSMTDFSGKEQVAAITACISYCFRSQGFARIIAEGLAYFTGDKYLLITNINRVNSILQKLLFQEARRSWQAVIKGLLLFCILYLQTQLSGLQIISINRCIKLGKGMEKIQFFFFLLSHMAINFVYICRYTHLHGFGYLDYKGGDFTTFRSQIVHKLLKLCL